MRILAIETSCDETGVAVVEGTRTDSGYILRVLGSALNSQAALHAEYGGVFPNLAKREHEKNLPLVLAEALTAAKETLESEGREASIKSNKKKFSDLLPPAGQTIFSPDFIAAYGIDAVAVTHGPGLEPTLWTGITFAQKLAEDWKLPLIPVNHMEGHLLSSIVQDGKIENIELPILGLLISGGHTEFVLMESWFHYKIIGQTLDDAIGEAFDKVARMLALPYPGGPEISKLAEQVREEERNSAKEKLNSSRLHSVTDARIEQFSSKKIAYSKNSDFSEPLRLPRPMLHDPHSNFSFSGLKTAVLYALRDRGGIQKVGMDERALFAREFEDAVTEVIVSKTKRALRDTDAQSFVIGGGVAANKHIRSTLTDVITQEFPDVRVYLPQLSLTGDNAIMIAMAALARSLSGIQVVPDPTTLRAQGNLSIESVK